MWWDQRRVRLAPWWARWLSLANMKECLLLQPIRLPKQLALELCKWAWDTSGICAVSVRMRTRMFFWINNYKFWIVWARACAFFFISVMLQGRPQGNYFTLTQECLCAKYVCTLIQICFVHIGSGKRSPHQILNFVRVFQQVLHLIVHVLKLKEGYNYVHARNERRIWRWCELPTFCRRFKYFYSYLYIVHLHCFHLSFHCAICLFHCRDLV